MKNHKSVFMVICCYILLNFVIGISGSAAADTEVSTSNNAEISEGPPLFKTIADAKTYIVQHQNRNGGWPLVPGGDSNVENTAFSIWALIDAGWGTGSEVIRTGVAYLRNTQMDNGSWNNNTAHTIFALIALTTAETDPEARYKGLQWLKKVQNRSGGWGKKERSPDNVLYTAAVLAGFRRLGFKQRFEPVSKGADWLARAINKDGGWALRRGMPSDIFLTSWVIQGLEPVYDIDAQIAWLKQLPEQGLAGSEDIKIVPVIQKSLLSRLWHLRLETIRSIPAVLQSTILAKTRQADGSFVSNSPIELTEPTANLQSTCFVLVAIHAKTADELAVE